MKNYTLDKLLYVLNFRKNRFVFFLDVIFNFHKKEFIL